MKTFKLINSIVLFLISICAAIQCNHITSSKTDKNYKILVTAPSNYALRLAQYIEDHSSTPIVMSTIETVINPDFGVYDEISNNPKAYQFVVLPSRKAIDAFFTAFKGKASVNDFRYITLGMDEQYMKESYGFENAIQLKEPSPQGIVNQLKKHKTKQRLRVAVIAPKVIGINEPDIIPDFLDSLQVNGIAAKKIEGYITRIPDTSGYSETIIKIKNGDIDFIAFSSVGEIEGLISIIGGTKEINRCIVGCYGPYTASNAIKLGIEVNYTGTKFHSFKDYASGIIDFLDKKSGKSN